MSLPTTSFAQDSPNSKSPVDRNRALNRLLKEAEDANAELTAARALLAAKEAEIKTADEQRLTMTEAYKQTLIEVGELRAKISFLEQAIAGKDEQIRILREDGARKDGEIKSLRRQLLIERVINAATLALKILR